MVKKKNSKQFSLPLKNNNFHVPDNKNRVSVEERQKEPDKKVIEASVFAEKQEKIKKDMLSSIINRAKHLYE